MKLHWLITIIASILAVAGCGKTETHTPATTTKPVPYVPPASEAWKAKRDQLAAAIKVGMTEDEVVKAVGEPKRVKSVSGAVPEINWQYELPDRKWLNVRFGKGDRVVAVELDSVTKIDG